MLSFREGNTRFLPIRVQKYNREYLIENRDQLWAEAVRLFKNGAQWWINDSQEAQKARDDFKEKDPWEEAVKGFLAKRVATGKAHITATEALDIIGIDLSKQTRAHEMRIAALFKHFGWAQKRSAKQRWWEPRHGCY